MLDGGLWMMDDEWWMVDDAWWMKDDGGWMMGILMGILMRILKGILMGILMEIWWKFWWGFWWWIQWYGLMTVLTVSCLLPNHSGQKKFRVTFGFLWKSLDPIGSLYIGKMFVCMHGSKASNMTEINQVNTSEPKWTQVNPCKPKGTQGNPFR